VNVPPGFSGGISISSCDDACEEMNIKTEQGTHMEIKVEEHPEPIYWSDIKAEPEVSYMSLCDTNIPGC
jgi:hypothetical protein